MHPPLAPSVVPRGYCLSVDVHKRHSLATCMAHVKQVKQKTYPSMVLMPSLYKIGYGLAAADEQLRFSLGAFHQPLCYHPPARGEKLRLSSRRAHKIAGVEDVVMTLFGHRNAGEVLVAQTQCSYAGVIPSTLLQ